MCEVGWGPSSNFYVSTEYKIHISMIRYGTTKPVELPIYICPLKIAPDLASILGTLLASWIGISNQKVRNANFAIVLY